MRVVWLINECQDSKIIEDDIKVSRQNHQDNLDLEYKSARSETYVSIMHAPVNKLYNS